VRLLYVDGADVSRFEKHPQKEISKHHISSNSLFIIIMNYLLTVTSLLFVLFPWSCSSWIPNNNPQRFALSSSQQQQQQERSTASSLAATKATTLDGKEIRGPITPLGNMILVRVRTFRFYSTLF
jgi:hypothetical protein